MPDSGQYQDPSRMYVLPYNIEGAGANAILAGGGIYQPAPEYSAYVGPTPPYATNNRPVQPLKPALRRTQTEEEARRTTRDAVDIVHAHTQGLRKRRGEKDSEEPEKVQGTGVLSNLLQLYGTSTAPRRSDSNDSQWAADNQAMSRATSASSYLAPTRGKSERTDSAASNATTLYEEDLDPYDPRIREKKTFVEKLAPVGQGLESTVS